MARLRKYKPKEPEPPKKSILEKFDSFLGTRIAPIASALGKGDLKQAGREIVTNAKRTNTAQKEQRERLASGKATREDLQVIIGQVDALPLKNVASKVAKAAKPGLFRSVKDFFSPTEKVIANQGEAGTKLKQVITKATDQGEVEAGKRVAQITEAKLGSLNKAERQNLFDVMEGRARPVSQKVNEAYIVARTQTDELAQYAKEAGVKVKRKAVLDPKRTAPSVMQVVDIKTGTKTFKQILDADFPRVKQWIDDGRKAGGNTEGIAGVPKKGKIYHLTAKTPEEMLKLGFKDEGLLMPPGMTSRQFDRLKQGQPVKARIEAPFEPKANYYPHRQVNVEELKKGAKRADVAENLVRQGIKPDIANADKFIDDYVDFIESGKRGDSIIKYMVDTGQAKNPAEALANLQRYRQRTIKRTGSLEFSRDVDLPFFDPDPSRVLPSFVADEAKRLEQIKLFGQNNENINSLIKMVADEGGDADFTRKAVDRILGIINDANTPGAKVSLFLRTIQGFKLGLASISNSSQGILNSLLAADLRAVAAGIKGLFTASGRMFALKSGASLESILQETAKESGALSSFLKATGFSATERMNRIIAANAGKSYGERTFKTLLKKPEAKGRKLLEEFGVNVEEALKRGSLTDDDVLLVAKKFSDITQFRSRPQDLPLFASSPAGKVFFQFKSFIYGQTRLLYRETLGELRNKNFGRAARNLLILGTVFPLAGEVIADIRSAVTGRERTSKDLERYFENIGQVGAMGILYDALRAGESNRGVDFIAGPTVGDAGELINIAGKDDKAKNLGKFTLRRIPLVGQVVSNRVLPTAKASSSKKAPTRRRLRK